MRRSLRWSRAGLACLALLMLWGCDDPFAPPRRARSTSTGGGSTIAKPNYLVYVVPGAPRVDAEIWGIRAQHEANDKRAVFRIMGPGPTDPPGHQPEVVRKALADGASALIVSPGDAPDLPKVLAEAQSQGVPVILIEKGLKAPEGSQPFTVVELGGFEDNAKKIVAATIEDLKKAGRPTDGTALLLVDKLVDSTSARRVEALKAAAEAAKFARVVTINFDGTKPEVAKQAVLEAVKAHPDVSVVLADDGEGLAAAATVRAEALGKPIFFVGGFLDYRPSAAWQAPSRESAYVEGRYAELGALAVVTALARIKGEKVADPARITPKFTRGEGVVSTPDKPVAAFPKLDPVKDATMPPKIDEAPGAPKGDRKPQ